MGQILKASYVHLVNPLSGTEVAAEMTHRFSTLENGFCIGSLHRVDPFTVVKTRFTDNGKVALLGQREWRPKSLVTVSAEYDTKTTIATPKLGLAIALKPWVYGASLDNITLNTIFLQPKWLKFSLSFPKDPEKSVQFLIILYDSHLKRIFDELEIYCSIPMYGK